MSAVENFRLFPSYFLLLPYPLSFPFVLRVLKRIDEVGVGFIATFQYRNDILNENYFLVSRDNVDLDGRFFIRNKRFFITINGCFVLLLINDQADIVEPRQHAGPQSPVKLPRPGGKNDRVDAAERRHIGTDIFS